MSKPDWDKRLDLREKYATKTWPHQFTNTGKTFQLGQDEFGVPVFAVEMTCIHCAARFVNGQTPRPADPCPARNEKRELGRILG